MAEGYTSNACFQPETTRLDKQGSSDTHSTIAGFHEINNFSFDMHTESSPREGSPVVGKIAEKKCRLRGHSQPRIPLLFAVSRLLGNAWKMVSEESDR
ncbi:hypothetical protein N7468_003949 [Penicillium chermesinum]|uniref:Uncharacterized protein n=1 Tax=Penicillium chermesinum TaxID=63820 RepID=A0A9W9P7L2_9EURO|nr:uncharacterized protein N7468_003949 [Penicillium chermesinum]KAJ5239330.1 hypothetical protein N7468_003949 [Penicillium chermesinum]